MRTGSERGYSLLELLIVIALLGMVAAIAIPTGSTNDELKLDRAATNLANAFRFARSEAIRTGKGHGFTLSQTTRALTVEAYDLTTNPIGTLATLTHPVSKQPYQFNIETDPGTAGVIIKNLDDVFDAGIIGLVFDASGAPLWILSSGSIMYPFIELSLELQYGNQERVVNVAQMIGRVTTQ